MIWVWLLKQWNGPAVYAPAPGGGGDPTDGFILQDGTSFFVLQDGTSFFIQN